MIGIIGFKEVAPSTVGEVTTPILQIISRLAGVNRNAGIMWAMTTSANKIMNLILHDGCAAY